MANTKTPKYKRKDKFIIEIAEVHTHYDDKKNAYSVYRVKGFKSMFLDDYALDSLMKVKEVDIEDVTEDIPFPLEAYEIVAGRTYVVTDEFGYRSQSFRCGTVVVALENGSSVPYCATLSAYKEKHSLEPTDYYTTEVAAVDIKALKPSKKGV